MAEKFRREETQRYRAGPDRERLRSEPSDRFEVGAGWQQGSSRATRGHDYYGQEGRSRGSQRVSPGGEYLYDPDPRYRTDRYTDQGFGENRGRSDWRTEDQLFSGELAPSGARGGEYSRPTAEQSAAERNRGRGPRGYRRSDERMREDVCEALTDDPFIDASNLEVTVQECEVTLSGTVTSREDKRRAEEIADRISGVRDVHNRLRISSELAENLDTPRPPSDRTTTRATRP